MSDTPETPPKPKIGSLRDRIAAFESKPAPAPAPAPAPRPLRQWKPKPADPPAQPSTTSETSPTEHPTRQWKPKPIDPPSHPSTTGETSPTATERKTSGMSATDARDSIQRAGGSLKERMAALQGKGAFGAPAPPPPVAAKPREWKKPVVSPPVEEEGKSPIEGATAAPTAPSTTVPADEANVEDAKHAAPGATARDEAHTAPTEHSVSPPAIEIHEGEGDAEGEAPEKTEEELEHERRAAIAARMARLGGARVGMAPIFGGPKPKPPPKPVVHEHGHAPEAETEKAAEEPKHERIAVLPMLPKVTSPPVAEKKHEPETAPKADSIEAEEHKEHEDVPEAKLAPEVVHTTTDASVVSPTEDGPKESPLSLHDAPSAEHTAEGSEDAVPPSPVSQPKQHIAMPLPAVPRRAGPPRRNRAPPPAPSGDEEKLLDSDQVAVKEAEAVKEDLVAAKEVDGPQLGPSETEPAVDGEPKAAEAPILEAKEEKHLPPAEPAHEEVAVEEAGLVKKDLNNEYETEEPETNEPTGAHEEDSLDDPTQAPAGLGDEINTEKENKNIVAEPEAPVAPEIPDSAIVPGGFSTQAPPSDESGTVETETIKPAEEEDEDEEAARRHRMAERMQKLGGVSFGMPVPSFPPKRGSTSSPERNTSVASPVSEASKPTASTIADTVHDEAEELAEEEQAAHAEGDTLDVKPGNEESPSGGKPLALPEREQTPTQALEYHEEGVGLDEEVETQEVEEVELASPATSLPTRSLPPPPPQQVVRKQADKDEAAAAGPEMDETSMDEEVAVDKEGMQQQEEEEEEQQHQEVVVEDANENLQAVTVPASGRPGRSLPPPPPPPPMHITHEDEAEDETDEAYHDIPEDANEVEVSNAEGDAPSLPAGISQTIVQKPLIEEETVHDQSGKPVVALVNTQAMVYDDDEPDPIDPTFYSPPSRQASSGSLPKISPQASAGVSPVAATGLSAAGGDEPAEPPHTADEPEPAEEDEGQTRRQTIAARMAKLGGLRFGAPPSMPPKRHAPPVPREDEPTLSGDQAENEPAEQQQDGDESATNEDTEYARRQAILARLVAGGGRGFSMAPRLAPPAPAPAFNRSVTEDNIAEAAGSTEIHEVDDEATADAEESEHAPPPPPRPQRAAVPPARKYTSPVIPTSAQPAPERQLPPVQPVSSSQASQAAVEPEDDFENITHAEEDSEEEEGEEEEEEEEAPPPPPPRAGRTALPPLPSSDDPPPLPPGRRTSSSVPGGRPPVPQAAPPRPPPRDSSLPQRAGSGHSGFTSVDDHYGSGRSSTRSPISNRDISRERTISPQGSFASPTSTSLSQWELPEIPSASLGLGEHTVTTLSSWSEDDSMYAAVAEPAAPPPPPKAVSLPDLDSDQLMVLWGSVGTRVLQAALQLAEQSKRAVIGDGSGDGLVLAALDMVPSAMKPLAPHAYGYLIFAMSGQSLQRRTSDIMEGDVAVITDAEFKGRRGLVPYHQHVGSASDPVVGVVHEFEPKNSKIRVLTASQHPNHYPTVESVSYRLEDLKQGSFKVYRIAQA